MKRNRYPGTRSFQQQDADIFFGREEDKKKLLQLIRLEQMLVLYGKSGLGKTSLLNAGVLPLLNKKETATNEFEAGIQETTWLPLEIRFHAWHEHTQHSPSDVFQQEVLGDQPLHPLLSRIQPEGEGWWYTFKSRQLASGEAPVILLIFDQFEELFTYPADQVAAFKRAFADLLNAEMPREFRKALREKLRDNNTLLNEEERKQLYEPLTIKSVFSIRSDRLSLLDQLTDTLPNMLVNLYELKPLNRTQAQSAIVLPALKQGEGFDSPKFDYSPAALTAILDHLSNDREEVEPFQIQYICEYAEDVIKAKGKAVVERNDLGDLGQLFRKFYENKIASIKDPAWQNKARRLLEDRLIFNGIRLSLLKEMITDKKGYNIPTGLLDELEDMRLLRAERRNDQVYYEISHDTLVAPILDSKKEWEAAQKAIAQEKARIEREKQLEEERKIQAAELAEAQRKRRRSRWIAVLMGLLAAVAIVAMIYANVKSKESAKNLIEAKKQTDIANDAKIDAEGKAEYAKIKENEAFLSADTAFQERLRAEEKETEARNAKIETDKALQNLETATNQAVALLLKDAKEHVLKLDYEKALVKIEAAAGMNPDDEGAAKGFMEIIFFHSESNDFARAMEILASAAQLLQKPDLTKGLQPLPKQEMATRDQFRNKISLLQPAFLDTLIERYYPVMIPVKGGTFTMGCDESIDENCGGDERPPHQVTLSDFKMAETETTIWQFALFCNATARRIKDYSPSWGLFGDNPAVNVSWSEAARYSNWLNKELGRDTVYIFYNEDYCDSIRYEIMNVFRLPTEAEWEFAARGGEGGKSSLYSGGNSLEILGWYFGNSEIDGVNRTHPVAGKKGNVLGLFDMSGNVWEWCGDWYDENYYEYCKQQGVEANPLGPIKGSYRVDRGGGWYNSAEYCRVSNRDIWDADGRSDGLGFRLAHSSRF